MSSRRVTTVPGAGQIVEVGGMLFSSSIVGAHPDSGQLSGDPSVQVENAFANLRRVLDRAGASLDNLGVVTVCIPAESYESLVDSSWARAFVGAGDRPARGTNVYPLPEGQVVQLQAIGVAGGTRTPLATGGLAPHDAAPTGVRVGSVVFSSAIEGRDPASGRLIEDPDAQVRQAFANMERVVEQAGGTRDDILHLQIFVRDRDDNDYTLQAFLDWFPTDGNRPARKNVFHDALKGTDTVAELRFVAVLGGAGRRNFEVPGFSKSHPNPAAAKVGPLLFSSGVSGARTAGAGAAQQARGAFEYLQTAIQDAGGSLSDVGLVTIVVSDYVHEAAVLDEWRRIFPDPADEPARHIMAFGGRGEGSYQVQIHIVAALDE